MARSCSQETSAWRIKWSLLSGSGGKQWPEFPGEDPTLPELDAFLRTFGDELKLTEYIYLVKKKVQSRWSDCRNLLIWLSSRLRRRLPARLLWNVKAAY